MDYIETPFTRDELCHVQEEEEFTNDPFVPQENEKCIVMIQIVSLEEKLRVVIQTGEGWGWDEETLKNEFRERPDGNHKWNPFSKMWEKVCEDCLELKHHNPNYDLFDYMTEDYVFGVHVKVLLCECDRCPRCDRFRYIDDCHFHDACERRE